ncbi:MAG: helix-turn-helix domain-containing protein [Candidatus Moranbacteria bacterium]|nr:helix-turn-helix domain-containing protein [Candidatus Moranbacteria bacterium]
MDTIKALLDFGLTEQEAQTYLTLFKLGGSTASALAKEAGLKRTTVYPILKALSQKGCVLVYFKKNQQYYYAQNPNKLAGVLEKKLDFFNSIIPLFESMEKKQAKTIGLRFIETKEELENFYNDVLYQYKNKKYRVIGNTNEWESIDPEFFANYRKERAQLNTKIKLLLSTDSQVSNPTEKSLLREFKYLPEKYKFKSTMNIFDDKVLIISPSQSSLAVVIAVPTMVDIFKSMFEIIWDSAQ